MITTMPFIRNGFSSEQESGSIRIREASVYALRNLPISEQSGYGTSVLTMRRWPRGILRKNIHFWVPTAGPSLELLMLLRTREIAWEQFLARYLEEQEQQERCRVVSYEQTIPHDAEYACSSLDFLVHLIQERGTVTILCWEQHEHCHRFTLVQRLTQLLKGDMPCHLH